MPSKHAKNLGAALALALAASAAAAASAQEFQTYPRPPGEAGSRNVEILSHLTLGMGTVADIEVEQDAERPYAYVVRSGEHSGFDLISLEDPDDAEVIYRWRIENPELHQGGGGRDAKYFKSDGRYYFILSVQFGQGGPSSEVGAIIFDVTGLPDVSTVREVGRITEPLSPGGFHNIFAYKHSDGRPILIVTKEGARMYDLDRFLAGDPEQGLIGTVGVPPDPGNLSTGYHDLYAAFDPVTQQDKFYGGGGGGYYVWDISSPEDPQLITTITRVAGFNWGHTFTPTPDGRYAVGEAEWQYQPLRIFDLKPGLDAAAQGELFNINRPIGAWHADWKTVAHNHEVRWPYVFVSGYVTGLSVFNMMDPTNPYTVAYYDTYPGKNDKGQDFTRGGNFTWGVYDGAWGVDVRNVDGLIVISDIATGFWAFKMAGFEGWNGNDWGMPNISSVQDWDNGPEGVQRPIS